MEREAVIAIKAQEAIEEDLRDRRGFRQILEELDDDPATLTELREAHRQIILNAIQRASR